MKILRGFDEININKSTAVAVGKFDGLHTGHNVLLNRIVQKKKNDLLSCAVTFNHAPAVTVLNKKEKLIMTRDEKIALLSECMVDYMLEIPFDNDFMKLSPEGFIELLFYKLNMKYMVCGNDFRYGYKGAGDIHLLKDLSAKLGFDLDIIEKIRDESREISSTYIREEIAVGHIANANKLLGHPYYIIGNIIHGNGIGASKIGRATINMIPSADKLLPPNGVYITEVILENRRYHGISNIGIKPTIEEKEKHHGIETHILDFNHDVYDKSAKIYFYEFLRPEIKFDSIDELKKQIETDVRTTYCYFNKK